MVEGTSQGTWESLECFRYFGNDLSRCRFRLIREVKDGSHDVQHGERCLRFRDDSLKKAGEVIAIEGQVTTTVASLSLAL